MAQSNRRTLTGTPIQAPGGSLGRHGPRLHVPVPSVSVRLKTTTKCGRVGLFHALPPSVFGGLIGLGVDFLSGDAHDMEPEAVDCQLVKEEKSIATAPIDARRERAPSVPTPHP